ncbi:MAG TPA: xanthine dehydrogenase family protein subunit M [Beijerinckiaceae bacterium]|jgi:carbon-monoxide dehydrogenase medium subunit|nr:xanthine dehydrogenase family protein subunit M [Beijerinckiaceae bacterium]
MKLPPFDYVSPSSLAEATQILAAANGAARPIAGGQSLMPLMAFRLTTPSLLVDLAKIPDLDRIVIGDDGVRLGARVRWCDIEADTRLASALPLLSAAIEHVAHYQIRFRGTVGGSLAHADPAAEMPGIAATADAIIETVGVKGNREIAAADFFVGPLDTSLLPDEIIIGVRFQPWPMQRRWAFEEFARRRGDFALAGIALFYDLDASGRAANAHIGVIGATDKPMRLAAAEAALNGRPIDTASIDAAARAAASAVEPPNDYQGSAEYRRSLVATLLERALRRAAA